MVLFYSGCFLMAVLNKFFGGVIREGSKGFGFGIGVVYKWSEWLICFIIFCYWVLFGLGVS